MRNFSLKLSLERLTAQLKRRGRAIVTHKYFRQVLGSNLTFMLIASSIIPGAQAVNFNQTAPQEEAIISVSETLKDSLKTEVRIHYPLEKVVISQGYNFFHPAIDFQSKMGATVNPMQSGRILAAGWDPTGYGNRVIIEHENGLETLYAHLSKIEVEKGEIVEPFTEIGRVGITGRSTGPHLHFEVRRNGALVNPYSVLPRIN